jgi:DNA-binding SARP family transcriptional activator/TolB-like protein/Flp pilus assembly protein TadD
MSADRFDLRLLGPVRIVRDGTPADLPRSRKVLALLAYLALEGGEQSRSRLCDLLWDGPNDPRGELRWGLSKLRTLLDDDQRPRVIGRGNALIGLDLSGAFVDALEVESVVAQGVAEVATERLVEVLDWFRGDLLEGLELDGSPEFTTWFSGRRQRFRALRATVAAELASRPAADAEEAHRRVERWLELAPLEHRAHQAMLAVLLGAGRIREAEERLAVAIRAFEEEGLDWSPLRQWWQASKSKAPPQPDRVETATSSEFRLGPSLEFGTERAPRETAQRRLASVAIMPFADSGPVSSEGGELAHGLTDDIITRLAKLRALFVIARGTTYALGERGLDAQEAGRILGVEYVATGRIRRHGPRISVIVELAETRDARIVWTDELVCEAAATFDALDAIVNRIVSAIAEEIESAECHRAILIPPSSLDAWQAYHRGLWHMYKFKGPDNREAERFFQSALELDPSFARAHAGLSFTHFQNVFLDLTPDRDRQIDLAFRTAISSVAADERDPAGHWALGRALWLRGTLREAVSELQRSVELSPNFALGHYTLGFVEAQSGDPMSAIASTNTSRELSPFDPLQFGMLASRALAHVRLGEIEEAVEWALKAIARPNAHAHILAIAAATLSLAGRHEEARALVVRTRERDSSYGLQRFLRAFRLDPDAEALLRKSASAIGFAG